VIITSGAVEVFDAETGAAHTVTYPDGVPAYAHQHHAAR
jgi:hypothetical protein